MNHNPNEIALQLRSTWDSQIQLVERLRRDYTLDNAADDRDDSCLPVIAKELAVLAQTSADLQEAWKNQGHVMTDELSQLNARQRMLVTDAIDWIESLKRQTNLDKCEVIKQLSEVNTAQIGYNGYKKNR